MNKTDYTAYARHFSVEELARKLSENRGIGRTVLKKVYELWYVLKSPATPTWAKALIVGAVTDDVKAMADEAVENLQK